MPLPDSERLSLIQDYSDVFSTQPGKKVLEDILKSFGKRPSYRPGDPHQTSYNEGARSVYLRIIHLLELAALPQDKRVTAVITEESPA